MTTNNITTEKDIIKGSIWIIKTARNNSTDRNLTVTDVDQDLVEFGFTNSDQIFYLTKSNFLNTYRKAKPGENFNKDQLLAELKETLVYLKSINYGDRVYAMLDEMGI